MKNIAAWTAVKYEGLYPSYVSINQLERATNQGISITVRNTKNETVTVTIPNEDWDDFVEQISKNS